MFVKHSPEIDIIEGFKRVSKPQIPFEAFRESLSNAIAHRDYLINSYIKIEMYDNRIEVISPGGLPRGITKELFFNDNLSVQRNPTIANVLNILKIIERFGTGIKRINNKYLNFKKKPHYVVKDEFIKVILPNLLFDDSNMNDESRILNLLDIKVQISRSDVENLLKINKNSAIELLNKLKNKNLVKISNLGKNTVYAKIK